MGLLDCPSCSPRHRDLPGKEPSGLYTEIKCQPAASLLVYRGGCRRQSGPKSLCSPKIRGTASCCSAQ